MQDLFAFIKARLAAEEQYATKLSELSRQSSKQSDSSPSLLSQIYRNLKEGTAGIAKSHTDLSDCLAQILETLKDFLQDNHQLSKMRKELIDATAKTLDHQKMELENAKLDAATKWNIAVIEERRHEVENNNIK